MIEADSACGNEPSIVWQIRWCQVVERLVVKDSELIFHSLSQCMLLHDLSDVFTPSGVNDQACCCSVLCGLQTPQPMSEMPYTRQLQ